MENTRTGERLDPLTKWEFEWFMTAYHYLWPADFDVPQVEEGKRGNLRVVWSDDDVTIILNVEAQERKGFLEVCQREDPDDYVDFYPYDPYEGESEDQREIMMLIDGDPNKDEPKVFDLSTKPGWDHLIDRVATAIYGEEWQERLEELRADQE